MVSKSILAFVWPAAEGEPVTSILQALTEASFRPASAHGAARKVEKVNKSLNANACNRTAAPIRVVGKLHVLQGQRAAVTGFTFWPVNAFFQVSCDQRLISILGLRSFFCL